MAPSRAKVNAAGGPGPRAGLDLSRPFGRPAGGCSSPPYLLASSAVTDDVLPLPAAPARRRAGRWAHTYAALDLGTNNCRLLVARPAAHGFRVIDAFSRITRLGEGVGTTGQLSPAAIG